MKAFPTPTLSINDEARVTAVGGEGGMDLRDYFAAKAMQGMLAGQDRRLVATKEFIGETAYEYADSMMKAREA
jgi:hypothetical protein